MQCLFNLIINLPLNNNIKLLILYIWKMIILKKKSYYIIDVYSNIFNINNEAIFCSNKSKNIIQRKYAFYRYN